MAIQVEHEKRKHEILEKSLELFIEEGYEYVTFQKIADRCGITRTTLYIYFKNKREIFLWSIKQLIASLEKELLVIIEDQSLGSRECMIKVLNTVLDKCEASTQFFKVLLSYLMQLQKSGIDANDRVERRVIRMNHLLSTIIIRGQRNGEFKKISVKNINHLLYTLVESAIFEIAVLGKKDVSETRQSIEFTVDSICLNK